MSKKLVIETVKDQGQAAELGFKKGDILKSYNGMPVETNRDLSVSVGKAKSQGKEKVTATIVRGDEILDFEITTSSPLDLTCNEEVANSAKAKVIIPQEVVVTDISMSFMSMVFFMVKWSLASIPAVAILMFIYAVLIKFIF
ncbi:PDZ domain-containing protein [Neptuniibacter sp.]|uniref:PDZ domain-containing protein n=1 Tax=Neptuniibacter sp. TaxID=1962643 RepID=UPI002615A0C4|nr:PDZ domain-containing protein [Neptuniibacter sp.]MCP4596170.1 PDZ domain-containing protein [Neptuniibacter sp.]